MRSRNAAGSLAAIVVLSLLAACSSVTVRQPAAAPMVQPKPITIPVGKNWQVIEEAPALRDERDRLPFQTEQSVQPPGAPPVAPSDVRKLETPPR